jgi:3alpha(or 20beta)-hydroxysteroid dehydrogenase
MGKLDGKVAIITGAASGMGAAQAGLFVQEVAQAALYLASDDASFMLGSELAIDGGMVL